MIRQTFAILAASALATILAVVSCAPPPPRTPDTTKTSAGNSVSTETPPAETSSSENAVPAETGSTAEEESAVQKNPPEIMNLFKEYSTWPPDSISQEEIEVLRNALVVLETTKGIIKIRVFPDAAPIHSANFVKLARDGYYDGIVFHRVISGFMSQGGDPTGTGSGGPGYTLPAEIALPHEAGSVAAARTGDEVNPERRSSGSQFYMCHSREGTARLDGAYTVFGKIVEGQDVNLSLNVTYTSRGPIEGTTPDKILHAWVELIP